MCHSGSGPLFRHGADKLDNQIPCAKWACNSRAIVSIQSVPLLWDSSVALLLPICMREEVTLPYF